VGAVRRRIEGFSVEESGRRWTFRVTTAVCANAVVDTNQIVAVAAIRLDQRPPAGRGSSCRSATAPTPLTTLTDRRPS